MRKIINTDLEAIADGLEHLHDTFPQMSLEEKVDVGARIRSSMKLAEALDKGVSDAIAKKLNDKDGTEYGERFRAVRKWCDSSRVDVKALKEEKPKVYNAYLADAGAYRITYEPR